jgi:hypothetical protein
LKLYARLEEDLPKRASTLTDFPMRSVPDFMDRFRRALDWMWGLHGGVALAVRLLLKLKVHTIHGPESRRRGGARRDAVRAPDRILKAIIAKVNGMPTNVWIRGRRQGIAYIDAAGACRQLRGVIKSIIARGSMRMVQVLAFTMRLRPRLRSCRSMHIRRSGQAF